MAVGNVINYTNYKAMYDGSSWRSTNTWTDSSFTVYINAPSFVLECRVSSVLFRSNWVNLTAYYWNGTEFVQAYAPRDDNGYTIYKSGANSGSIKFYHNRAAEGTTSGDQMFYHLWKIVIQMRGADGSAHGYFSLWTGGIEMCTETEYNAFCKWRYLKYSSGAYYTTSTYSSDSAFVAGQKPTNWAGTPVSISSGTANKLCYTSIS